MRSAGVGVKVKDGVLDRSKSNLPSVATTPTLRVLFVPLEAPFTFVSWALLSKTDHGYDMGHICSWARHTLGNMTQTA